MDVRLIADIFIVVHDDNDTPGSTPGTTHRRVSASIQGSPCLIVIAFKP